MIHTVLQRTRSRLPEHIAYIVPVYGQTALAGQDGSRSYDLGGLQCSVCISNEPTPISAPTFQHHKNRVRAWIEQE